MWRLTDGDGEVAEWSRRGGKRVEEERLNGGGLLELKARCGSRMKVWCSETGSGERDGMV